MLTPKQVSEQLGVSDSLVYEWCGQGLLPHFRFGRKGKRGKVMIEQSDLTLSWPRIGTRPRRGSAAQAYPDEPRVGRQAASSRHTQGGVWRLPFLTRLLETHFGNCSNHAAAWDDLSGRMLALNYPPVALFAASRIVFTFPAR